MANSGSEYRKNVSGGGTTFEVTPAPTIKFGWMLLLGAPFFIIGLGGVAWGLLILVLGGGLDSSMGFGLVFLGMGGFALRFGWKSDPRPKASRQPMSFKVTPDSIEAGGRKYMKDDIHRIILKNAITDRETDLTTYTTSNSVAQGMTWRAANAQIASTLNVESEGKSTVIAGGMDDMTAYGLLRDVCKILDMKVN